MRTIETTRIARSRLFSLSQPAPGLDARSFLELAAGQERYFWQEPGGGLALAGSGVAYEIKAWGERRFSAVARAMHRLFANQVVLKAQAQASLQAYEARPRFFGGFAFRQDFIPDHVWDAFSPAHFILPHYQFVEHHGKTWLTVNALLPPGEDPESIRPALEQALALRYSWLVKEARGLPSQVSLPAAREPLSVRYPMSFEDWSAMLNAAIGAIGEEKLRKVVLARMCELSAGEPFDLGAAMCYLDGAYPECYRFLFEPRPEHAFFGATPELLAAVTGDHLQSMALAGSIRRGKTAAEDITLAAELLASAKDRFEHDVVAQTLRRRLRRRSLAIEAPAKPLVLQLSNIQHLHTPVLAHLRQPGNILQLVSRLHPTPALGGDPDRVAQNFIRDCEPVTRGWYAAPVGWVDAEMNGVFAVAIRSAVVQRTRAWLYAGAGIMQASQPEKEWAETALKFRPMLQALGVPRRDTLQAMETMGVKL